MVVIQYDSDFKFEIIEADIEKLKERVVNAESDTEIEAIDKEMRALADKSVGKFAEGMLECIKDTNKSTNINTYTRVICRFL